jgi:hypothetical protein
MDVHDTLSTLLPPPRDDEPASLRQDILDELGDHLACAYNRELLRGANSRLARQRVLELFGDPAAVARRLWLDAMKGKIMGQRVLIATCLVVTLACLSLVGLVWVQASRAAAQTHAVNRMLVEALAQSQIASQTMLKTLGDMSDAIRNPRSPDWNPVKIRVTEDTAGGPPVAGCFVSLSRGDQNNQTTIDRTTGQSGAADFGLLHPGTYSFRVSKSPNDDNLNGSGEFNVEPGSHVEKQIVYPTKALERVTTQVRCNWPADLEKCGLVIDASFILDPLLIDDTSWSTNVRSLLCGPGAALTEILAPAGLYVWATNPNQKLRADLLTSQVRSINESGEPLKWERGTYRLFELRILRPIDTPAGSAESLQFEILVHCSPWQTNSSYEIRSEPPNEEELRNGGNVRGGGTHMGMQGLVISQKSWANIAARSKAAADNLNEWTITLPDEVTNVVREKIRSEKAAKPG